MSGDAFTVLATKRDIDRIVERYERLADFKKLVKAPVQAALDESAKTQRAKIKRGKSGKAQASIGTHIHTTSWGVYGNAGPRGGRWVEGFLAALFLDIGTGMGGPLHRRIIAKRVFAFPAYTSAAGGGLSLFGQRFGAKAKSTTSRGKFKAARYGAFGEQFARSTAGMPPQPWGRAAKESSRDPSKAAFHDALTRAIAETSRG